MYAPVANVNALWWQTAERCLCVLFAKHAGLFPLSTSFPQFLPETFSGHEYIFIANIHTVRIPNVENHHFVAVADAVDRSVFVAKHPGANHAHIDAAEWYGGQEPGELPDMMSALEGEGVVVKRM